MISVAHVITGSETGGAERVLSNLLAGLNASAFQNRVVTLRAPGPMHRDLSAHAQDAVSLDSTPLTAFGSFHRLVRLLRQWQPDVVQTWMFHADLLGGLAARLAGCPTVVWNLRHSSMPRREYRASTVAVAQVNRIASRVLPQRIIACSHAGAEHWKRRGYPGNRVVVIPNGFAAPVGLCRDTLRTELRVDEDAFLITRACRWHPQKDIPTFLEGVALASRRQPRLIAVLCGPGMSSDNLELAALVRRHGLEHRVHLLGRREDMGTILGSTDLLVSSSAHGEAQPNIIGEAMASAVPVVATDVGDCAWMLQDVGIVVPRRHPQQLAEAMVRAADLDESDRASWGRRHRERAEATMSIASMVARYEALYQALVPRQRHSRADAS